MEIFGEDLVEKSNQQDWDGYQQKILADMQELNNVIFSSVTYQALHIRLDGGKKLFTSAELVCVHCYMIED